jgi:hypothetical protein
VFRENGVVLAGDQLNEAGTAAQTRAELTATANWLSFFMMLSRLMSERSTDEGVPGSLTDCWKGYAGPVVVCSVAYEPMAGHRASTALVKYLSEGREMEIASHRSHPHRVHERWQAIPFRRAHKDGAFSF